MRDPSYTEWENAGHRLEGDTELAPGPAAGLPLRALPGRGKLAVVPWISCTLLYAAAAALLIYLSRDQLNPDAVSYFQSARQYLAGRADLAVNSWFGPLLSWLLIPAAAAGLDLQIAAKVIAAAAGLGLAAGAAVLTRRMTGGRYGLPAFASGLLLALGMLPKPITPDMLLACLITWYLVAASRVLGAEEPAQPRRVFLAGVVGSVAYLAKAYAIPFVLVHLALTVWFGQRQDTTQRRRETEEQDDEKRTGEPNKPDTGDQTADKSSNRLAFWRGMLIAYLAGVLGLLLPAAPWIAIISIHDGVLTHSSAQRGARAFSPVEASPLPMKPLQLPRPGRTNVWENPVECSRPWPHWSPFDGRRGLELQLETIRINGAVAFQKLWQADLLGLLLVSLLATTGVCLWRRLRNPPPVSSPRYPVSVLPWACLSALLYLGGYVIVYAEERFLWPTYGLLVAICFGALHRLLSHLPDRPRSYIQAFALTVAVLSMAWRPATLGALWADQAHGEVAGYFAFLRTTAKEFPLSRPVACNKWDEGLAVCYWRDQPFMGMFQAADANAIAAELAPFGEVDVLIFWHEDLAQSLLKDSRFTLVKRLRHEPTGHTATLLRHGGVAPGARNEKGL